MAVLSPLLHEYTAEHTKQHFRAMAIPRSAESTSMIKSSQSCEKQFIKSPSVGTSISHTNPWSQPFPELIYKQNGSQSRLRTPTPSPIAIIILINISIIYIPRK